MLVIGIGPGSLAEVMFNRFTKECGMGNRIHLGMTLVLCFSSMLAHAGELSIRETVIIGAGTPVPGVNGATFESVGVTARPISPPASDDGAVMFWGEYLDPNNNVPAYGIFRHSADGSMERLVDTTMIMPGKGETFEDITEFSTNEGNGAFLGARYSDGSFEGVYRVVNGNLQVVADPTISLPGLSSPAQNFWHPIIEGDRIAFVTEPGIFQWQSGVLEPMVLTSELIPGRSDTFQGGFGNITFDHGDLRFLGLGPSLGTGNWHDMYEGIFTKTASDLFTVADVLTPIPGGTGNFLTFGAMDHCGGTTFGFS